MQHGLPPFEGPCAYHADAGWCTDEFRPATHWHPETTKILREARAIGFAAAITEFRAHAEKIRNATEDVSDETIIAAARAQERERCAKIADEYAEHDLGVNEIAIQIAARIRSG